MTPKRSSQPRLNFDKTMWTLVQHSAYSSRKKDLRFMNGLEEASVTAHTALAKRIVKLGGVLYADYGVCSDAGHAFMYPDDYYGLVPVAQSSGRYEPKVKIDGRSLYIPNPKGGGNE